MNYLISIAAGVVVAIVFMVSFALIRARRMALKLREQGQTVGEVGVNIIGTLPLTLAAVGFAAGFYLVFRISN